MYSPFLYMIAGAVAYAVLTRIYRRYFDATAGDVDVLVKENRALQETLRVLRIENEQMRSLIVGNHLEPPARTVEIDEAAIRREITAGRKINAIKLYRDSSGLGLKESKDFVEALAAAMKSAPLSPADLASSNDRIPELVRAGNKIAAIRDYRAATGASLLDAKTYVEQLERQIK